MEYKIMTSATEGKAYQMPFGARLDRQTHHEIFGIGFDTLEDSGLLLDRQYDGDECGFESVTRRIYDSEDEDYKNFRYRYHVQAEMVEGDSDHVYCTLAMVPLAEYLGKRQLTSIMRSCGVTDAEEVSPYDIAGYCGGVIMAHCTLEATKVTKETIDLICSVIEPVDRMRGFYLDAPKNRIGYTGWDYLDMYLKDKSDREVLDTVLKRYRQVS